MIFENEAVNIADLPRIKEEEFQQLDSNYLVVSYIGRFIFFLFLGFALLIAYLATDLSDNPKIFWGLVGFWIVWAIASFILTNLGYKIRGYVLRDKDLVHRKGVLFKSITTIPFNRVQHCEVSQGVIQRMFDLHTLQVFTAGGSNSDLSIPGLKADTAARIKEFIIKKTAIEGSKESLKENIDLEDEQEVPPADMEKSIAEETSINLETENKEELS